MVLQRLKATTWREKLSKGGRHVVPAPAGDFELGEVGLPVLVDRVGGVGKPVGATIRAGPVISPLAQRSRKTFDSNCYNPFSCKQSPLRLRSCGYEHSRAAVIHNK